MYPFEFQSKPIEQQEIELLEDVLENNQLLLYNDDVNTFDWVINCLIEICHHDVLQAEQCAMLVHFNGKCAVKEGTYTKLEPMCTALLDRGLSAVIE